VARYYVEDDFFISGAGGLDIGFMLAGYDIICVNDINPILFLLH